MTDLSARYGRQRSRRRPLLWGATVVLTALVVWTVWMFVAEGRPQVTSEQTSYDVVDEHTISTSYTVVRDRTDRAATCYLRAFASDRTVVGQAQEKVASGPRQQQVTTTIRTERKASGVELLGCSTAEQKKRR